MKEQISSTDERIDKHIEAQTDRYIMLTIDRFVDEFTVWWIPYDMSV